MPSCSVPDHGGGTEVGASVGIVVGNPKSHSRTFQAATVLVRQLTGADPDFAIDLASFGPALLDWSDPEVAGAVARVQAARLVVIASPTFKAAYTGLLKLFLDRFPAGSLAGVLAVALQLGGDRRHALAPEVHLKPVLAEIGAATPTPALFLLDSEAERGFENSPALLEWLDIARPRLVQCLARPEVTA